MNQSVDENWSGKKEEEKTRIRGKEEMGLNRERMRGGWEWEITWQRVVRSETLLCVCEM